MFHSAGHEVRRPYPRDLDSGQTAFSKEPLDQWDSEVVRIESGDLDHVEDPVGPENPADLAQRLGSGKPVADEEGKMVKNRLHIDVAPSLDTGQDAEVRRLEALGARRVDVGQDPDKVSWVVMADPEDNEFCVLSARD